MPNSTVLADIRLQIQDNLNPNSTPLNRFVPQFVLPTTATAAYAGYYSLNPNTISFINTGSTQGFSFLFIRNATQGGDNKATFTITYTDISSGNVNVTTLSPGGILLVGELNPNTGSFTNVEIATPASGLAVVVEIMYAV